MSGQYLSSGLYTRPPRWLGFFARFSMNSTVSLWLCATGRVSRPIAPDPPRIFIFFLLGITPCSFLWLACSLVLFTRVGDIICSGETAGTISSPRIRLRGELLQDGPTVRPVA